MSFFKRFTSMMTSIVIFVSVFLNAFTPAKAVNIQYDTESKAQLMDIYYPENPKNINEPVSAILFIHGGAWAMGTKSERTNDCKAYAEKGFITATMNYRMVGDGASYLDMLDDIESALQTLKQHAAKKGVTIKNVALMGHSAGGHLSLLYSYRNYETSPIDIAFAVGQAPPSYFLDPDWIAAADESPYMYSLISSVLGVEVNSENVDDHIDVANDASPYFHLDANCPPSIVCFAGNDELVPISNGLLMEEKLAQLAANDGYEYEYLLYENSGHMLESDPDMTELYNALFMEFAAKYM